MNKNWTKIYSDNRRYMVEIYHSVLEENEIESIVIDKKDSLYLIGLIELYVRVEDAFDANIIIQSSMKDLENEQNNEKQNSTHFKKLYFTIINI